MLQTPRLSTGQAKGRANNQVHKPPSNNPPAANKTTEVSQTSSASSTLDNETLAQCHKILSMLQTKLAAVKTDHESVTHIAGTCLPYKNRDEWIIDSGASTHICFQKHVFSDFQPIASSVTLPNSCQIPVHYGGSVRLFDSIVLKHFFMFQNSNTTCCLSVLY